MVLSLFEWAYVVAYVTFAIGLLSSVARFYSRALVLRSWGWDDTASCLVLVVSIVHQVVLQLFLNLGCGKPGNVNCSFQSLDLLRISFIEEIVIYGAHSVIKMTFLLFYLRLSVGQTFRGFVYLGFALAFSVFLSSLLLTVLQCIPFEKILNPMSHPEVTCIDMRVMMLTPPILNIFMDLYIVCLPIPSVLTLQMNLRRKVTVVSVLAFGIISVTVAIIRLPILISVSTMKTDLSTDVGKMIIVASFEVQCAIVAANLPAMKALWGKVRGKYSSAGSYERSNEKPYHLSSMRRGLRNKRASMGTITRLEQGLTGNESQVELVEGLGKQPGPPIFGLGESQSTSVKSSRQNSIIVTTELDVRHTPIIAPSRHTSESLRWSRVEA